LRPTVSRPVSLGIGPPFATLDQSLFCSSFVGQLRCSAFNASSLTRKRVCDLLLNCFLALPEQSHFSRSPTELTANLEGQVPVFILVSPRNRVAQLYPRALGSLSVASYDSQGLRWKYSNPPPHGGQPGGPGPRIYIPQEQGGPVTASKQVMYRQTNKQSEIYRRSFWMNSTYENRKANSYKHGSTGAFYLNYSA
jgi:hypothetical protein